MKVFRGTLVHSKTPECIEIIRDAIIGFRENTGQIVFIEECGDGVDPLARMKDTYDFDDWHVETLLPSQFLMPGMIDTHIHAPQYRFTGTGYDKQLLDWLDTYTFPTESKFADVAVAHDVYPRVVKRTLCHGTTTASYFATIHLESTKELCRTIAAQGQRALVGKVNMDVRSPDYYIETTEDSIKDTLSFIEYVDQMKNPLIQPVITPRFSPTCSEPLMKKLAEIAAQKNLCIQSHMCEQLSEIEYTLQCFPEMKHCAEIFDKQGLLTEKTYLAHCIHLNEDDLSVLKDRKVGIAHCPNSNFSLRSGIFDTHKMLTAGMKVGLGTDVSGGYHPSVFDALRVAIHASKALGFGIETSSHKAISHHEGFYLATLGGAQVLNLEDKVGNFEVGKQFDALVIDTAAPSHYPVFDTFTGESFDDILSKFLYLGDDRNIIRVFVNGQEVICKQFW